MSLTSETLVEFRALVESQTPRRLRGFRNYGERVRSNSGLPELRQWLGRILLDSSEVYSLKDKAQAFEICACESLAEQWPRLQTVAGRPISVLGTVDKTLLLAMAMHSNNDDAKKATYVGELSRRYIKTWKWIASRAQVQPERSDERFVNEPLAGEFINHLCHLSPEMAGLTESDELGQIREELAKQERAADELTEEMRASSERAHKSQQRALELEAELKEVRKQLSGEEDAHERLRAERNKRISLERQARDAEKELQSLRQECVKLDRRLRGMSGNWSDSVGIVPLELRGMRAEHVLGLGSDHSDRDIGEVRRRFANAFHSDRVSQLPAWVGAVFDELMGFVNETCDRLASRK